MLKGAQQRGCMIFSNTSHLSKRFYCKPLNNDELVLTEFVNRNPRSMELLRIARKPQGFMLDVPTINFYYRLNFDRSTKNLEAWVEHNSGRKVVSASTKEWAIRRHLYSSIDTSAAQNLGRILARRCLQAGIFEMHTDLQALTETSERLKIFLKELQDGGITLGEAPQIREKQTYTFIHKTPTFPWEVTEEEVDVLDFMASGKDALDSRASGKDTLDSKASKEDTIGSKASGKKSSS